MAGGAAGAEEPETGLKWVGPRGARVRWGRCSLCLSAMLGACLPLASSHQAHPQLLVLPGWDCPVALPSQAGDVFLAVRGAAQSLLCARLALPLGDAPIAISWGVEQGSCPVGRAVCSESWREQTFLKQRC